MYCSNCGAKLDESARFCSECGAPQEPVNTQPVYQPGAGGVAPGSGYAAPGYTASGYSGYIPPPTSMPPRSEGKNGLLKILIPIAAIVVILAVLVALEGFRVVDIIPSWPGSGSEHKISSASDDENVIIRPSPPVSPSLRPSTPPPVVTSPSGAPAMSGKGGEMKIDDEMEVMFTPDSSGGWIICTRDNGESDPYLKIYDSRGNEIANDDDGASNYNSLIITFLNEGETYKILAGLYSSGAGGYTLEVSRPESIPGRGGDVRISRTTAILFTPDHSGAWELRTGDNGDSDPFIKLFSENGDYITENDDGPQDWNALIVAELEGGRTYVIVSGIYSNGTGGFTLSVGPYAEDIKPVEKLTGAGVTVLVEGPTKYEFVADEAGVWAFVTTNCGNSDPYLDVFDTDGNQMGHGDDCGGTMNAFVVVYLEAGESCYIDANYYSGESESYLLTALQALFISGEGGTYAVDGKTVFIFQPVQSGTWEFTTSNSDGDPVLSVFDVYDSQLAYGDDYGDSFEAYISIEMDNSELYLIYAMFIDDIPGTCDLNVIKR